MSNSSILPIHSTLSIASTPVQIKAMVMKGYSALLEPHHQIFQCHTQDTRCETLPLCRDRVGVFCCRSRLGHFGSGLTPQERCSRSILQPKPIGLLQSGILIITVIVVENGIAEPRPNPLQCWLRSLCANTHGKGMSVRQWPWRPGFNPRSSHTKDSKNGTWCLLA